MISIRDVVIDPEFEALIPPMADEQRIELMKSVEREGFRDKIVVWLNHSILLDGHNRLHIWQDCYTNEPDREPEIVEIHCADREAAKRWIILNQLARRNLTPEQSSYLRGLLYEQTKKDAGRPAGKRDQIEPVSRTAETIAAETGVSPATVKRDAKFAKDVDAIAKVAPEAKAAILSGKTKATRPEIAKAAALPEPERKEAAAKIASGSRYEPGSASLPKVADHADADDESDTLFQLKRLWSKATKKDRKAFLAWTNGEQA